MKNGESSYRRFLDGEKDAVVEIVSQYNDGLVLYLNTITQNICLSEEIAEDIFCQLLIHKPEFKGESSFKTWLYTIAQNYAFKLLKKKKYIDRVPLDEHYELSDENNLESSYIRDEQKIEVHRALSRIKPEYSQVLYLTFFENFSNSETANIMRKNNRQIENLIYRAKKALKSELEREGFVYEEL